MLTEIYIEALLVDEELADEVWDEWDAGEADDQIAFFSLGAYCWTGLFLQSASARLKSCEIVWTGRRMSALRLIAAGEMVRWRQAGVDRKETFAMYGSHRVEDPCTCIAVIPGPRRSRRVKGIP